MGGITFVVSQAAAPTKGSRAASLAVSINGGNLSLALSGTGR